MFKRGMVTCIDGMDGVGKSTVIRYIRDKFRDNEDVVFINEPGYGEVGAKVKELLMDDAIQTDVFTDIYLFAAARADIYRTHVIDAIIRDKIVVSDRSIVSSMVLQGMQISASYNSGLGMNTILEMNKYAFDLDKMISVIIDCEPAEVNNRLNMRPNKIDKRDIIDVESISKVRNLYLDASSMLCTRGVNTDVLLATSDTRSSRIIADDLICSLQSALDNK